MKTLIALLLLSVQAQAAIAYVNTTCRAGNATDTTDSTSALAVTTGNVLWVQVSYVGDCSVSDISVTDTASNTFTPIGAENNSAGLLCSQLFRAGNVTGNASDVITAHFTATSGTITIIVLQFSGVDAVSPLDAGPASAHDVTGTTPASATFSTDTADEVLVAGIIDYYISDTIAAGSGYTIPMGASCASSSIGTIAAQYKIVSSTQSSVTAAFAITGSGYSNIGVGTFRQASAGATRKRSGTF